MQTCTVFTTWCHWVSHELEKTDPDLLGTTKPAKMTDDHWKHFQAIKAQRPSGKHSDSTSSANGANDQEARIANLFDIVKKWESNFSRHLQILLDALNHYAATETVVLLSLCARLSTANHGTEYAGLRNEEDMQA
jgi:gamma-tubulin complex component 2